MGDRDSMLYLLMVLSGFLVARELARQFARLDYLEFEVESLNRQCFEKQVEGVQDHEKSE